jgi:DNA-binding CsgD family transcriptional regulator/tetratricopeptide (TPR) repeat protein
MTVRVSSAALVGRGAEIERLDAILQAAEATGDGRLVMVGGDAGIGKTRLVDELCDRARARGWLAVVGGCVDLGEVGLAYGPLVEVVRRLRAELGADATDHLLDPPDPDGQASGALGPLLTGAGRADVATTPARLLERVVGFFERLGSTRPALVVFEDLHWADQSTRELVAYLARNLPPVPIVLLGTYRMDELHRRHPLRAVLAELHRNPAVERIELSGLGHDDVATLVAGIAEAPLSADVIDELADRSEGNPFYLEELLAAGTGGHLPETLREVILARIERLSETAQALLRRAAVLGRDVDEAQLGPLTDLDPLELADGLREALASQVLVGDPGGCRFRHALVQEAVYGELLPGERQRLHTAAARALEENPGLVAGPDHVRLALLAHHWEAANDLPRCLLASVQAGEAAEAVGAFGEAAAHDERALEYWDQVPAAADAAGVDRTVMMLRTASALHLAGRAARAAGVARAALAELGGAAEPEERAAVLERIARYHWVAGDEAHSTAAYEEAAALLADRPPSHAKAQSMASLGQSLMVRSRLARAQPLLRDAIEVARSIHDRAVEGHALCSLATVQGELGLIDEAQETFDRALAIARTLGDIEEVGRVHVNLSSALMSAGRCEEAVAVVRAGLDHALGTGLLLTYGRAMAGNGAAALVNLGRWDEALALVSRLDNLPGEDIGTSGMEAMRGTVAVRRGDLEAATAAVSTALRRTAGSNDIMWRGLAVIAAAELATERNAAAELRRWVAELTDLAVPADSSYYGMPAFAMALRSAADDAELAAAQGPAGGDDLAAARAAADRLVAQARDLADQAVRLGGRLLADPAAWLAVIEAEWAGAQGLRDADLWDAAARRWEDLGYPYPTAQARFREAEAVLFTRGPRARAAEALTTAADLADRLGAAPLARRVRTLARQARLTLDRSDRPAGSGRAGGAGGDGSTSGAGADDDVGRLAGLGLTEREAEVLALVAEGFTNRQIGERLFISDKTASVHVTNLLRKLGVPSRTAAAAVARRLGVGDDASGHGGADHPGIG